MSRAPSRNPRDPARPLTAALLKQYRALAEKKERRDAGLFLVEGRRAIRQVLTNQPERLVEILATPDQSEAFAGLPVRAATRAHIETICHAKTPQGAVAIVRLPDDAESDHLPEHLGPRVLVLEGVQDPGNVGGLIRTAAAFAYSLVILSPGCADPFAPKCVQASSGTVLSVAIRRTSAYLRLVQTLKERGYSVTVADVRGGDPPSRLQDQKRLVFALGSEAAGPTDALLALADHRIRIPIDDPRAESLNVAACGAIGMYLGSRVSGNWPS